MEKRRQKRNRRNRSNNRREGSSNKLSYHFSKRDFACKCGACKNKFKISLGLVGALELLRSKIPNRINIVKGYICPTEKEASKSYKRDYHAKGVAADISIVDMDVKDVFKLAEDIAEIKGIGLNLKDNYVHVDTRKEDERKRWVMEGDTRVDLTEDNYQSYLA